ncbi:peptide synthase [Mycobacterium marinum]|uniref:AMP-binding protein n=1 Tax=Mycobacterium marinum TaxID=1781 RepID=UPI000CD7ED80|nr:AMP-binding protein [Mycobacterium marinum]AXN47666.1 Dimodular nonribosomal peptide synthase [Mycobacterium marinum]RFZ23248.1 Dimodular nonribosomal peptide synthase [Mycobacterium marinum]RFZ26628.1 Dimodular nonribosomal peptide synthase [Mycobacterium marinum]RFZ36988.1 Dimodular nonribosomal peptide synthase [Mycobacterium marinum]WOR04902.1 AMP-binding protein [Mycobacterium marinum]
MTAPEIGCAEAIPLSKSQQNLYNGVLQDNDPALYLIGKRYRFHPLGLSNFLAALEASVLNNPVQLCVLQMAATGADYPQLVPRLQFNDLVLVRSAAQGQPDGPGADLEHTWSSGILDRPLVRYTVSTDEGGDVCGLDVHTHHILLDGGATGIIEADLAHFLAASLEPAGVGQMPTLRQGLAKLAAAHLRETAKVAEALRRQADAVQRELTAEAGQGGGAQGASGTSGAAAKGVLQESIALCGPAYDALRALSEAQQVPLNVLVAAAAVAVQAGLRQSTESLLVHAVDNRFGDPELNVATCLVNSVAHALRFRPFASVREVVRDLDRGYVKAVRRRWIREEHYRRMYLAINRTSHVQALTLNFIRESCAPGLRPFLSEAPVATEIGPIEGTTVACVLDEQRHTLNLAIWDRADLPERNTGAGVAARIGAALESMAALWDQPIAMTANEWFEVGADGLPCRTEAAGRPRPPSAPAWFVDAAPGLRQFLDRRRQVYPWVGWLVCHGVVPGDVLVCTDDDTDKTVDLLLACHLAGCGYSMCESVDDLSLRATTIGEHCEGSSAHPVDVATVRLGAVPDHALRERIDQRLDQVARDPLLATKAAYIMPTSGTTGQPKLVRISHGSLAAFCAAIGPSYGWNSQDTILQCAPLTSDISVEEIFGAAVCGAELVRSAAMKTGDLGGLARDIHALGPTVVDLPTAVWHLLCEDGDAVDVIGRSRLRQIVIGGESIRTSTVDKWVNSPVLAPISLVSSYGPTEATVVATHLPIVYDGIAAAAHTRLRVGLPMAPNTVFIAFGEVVIAGPLVSDGYLGIDDSSFGAVAPGDGSQLRAFATADRVTIDEEGFPVFAGRKDTIVKVAGKRVDTAAVARRITADPTVCDVAVEPHDGRLGVWFETERTREAAEDGATAGRIGLTLASLGVPAFFVVAVPSIPRKPNGKVDGARLHTLPQLADAVPSDAEAGESAAGLARVWSRHLGRPLAADSSLLGAGIGSLDLIRILPDTRRYLGRHLSVLELISADTAANLVCDLGSNPAAPATDGWLDAETAAAIERDLVSLGSQCTPQPLGAKPPPHDRAAAPIVVLGASGIVGTGFARAVLERKQAGLACPEIVLASRSKPPEHGPWSALRGLEGIRIEQLGATLGAADLDALICDTGARSLINCIGNTNVLVPYRGLRAANVELVSTVAQVCAQRDVRLVHLSTFVISADVTAPRVTDPRVSPYPYAASKSLAELIVAASSPALDFTIVRLPRVLGEDYQLRESADILVSVVDACMALRAFPTLTLTEEVTTGRAAAQAILGLLPQFSGAAGLGHGITVVRGAAVQYRELLGGYALDEIDAAEWKHRLDQSDWARRNPQRWSVVDAWVSLGMRLGARSYSQYLDSYPSIPLQVGTVAEIAAPPPALRALLEQGCAQPPRPALA